MSEWSGRQDTDTLEGKADTTNGAQVIKGLAVHVAGKLAAAQAGWLAPQYHILKNTPRLPW